MFSSALSRLECCLHDRDAPLSSGNSQLQVSRERAVTYVYVTLEAIGPVNENYLQLVFPVSKIKKLELTIGGCCTRNRSESLHRDGLEFDNGAVRGGAISTRNDAAPGSG